VVVELPNIGHFVALSYLGKVTEVFPLTPSGLEMAFKRLVWGTFTPPNYDMRVNENKKQRLVPRQCQRSVGQRASMGRRSLQVKDENAQNKPLADTGV